MKRILVPTCGLLLVVGTLAPVPAFADSAPADPSDPRTPATVTADALPTAQINGVVWDQEVIGNTVYAVGEFTSARPAGAAAGQQETPRANILAYRLDTGELIKEFAPTANGVVKSVTASPDGKKLYIGGSFTAVNGEDRYRIAAMNPATGVLDAGFRPVPDSRVNAIVTDGKTVYFGGWFSSVGNQPRGRLAAVDATTGELRNWTPVADDIVEALVLSPDGKKIVAGGMFESLNGSDDPGMGMGALSTADGTLLPWKVGSTVRNGVGDGGISALSTDGTHVYGTGWTWLRNSNLEGSFKASWTDGSIEWLQDCHGDSYDVAPHAGAVYVGTHAHNCESLGEFTDSRPRSFYRGVAFSEATTGVLGSTYDSYFDFSGNPAPSMLNWYPDLEAGPYTGQWQAAWTVEAAGDYVLMGGEFPRVNGKGQQGLVRFTTRAKAPNAVGPRPGAAEMGLTASSHSGGTVSLTWTAASDQDNQNLTYRVVRDGNTAQPVGEVKGRHRFFNRARMGYTDLTAQAGKQHSYQVVAVDPTGRTVSSSPVQVTTAGGSAPTGYTRSVLQDTPTHYWRMGSLTAGLQDVAGGAPLAPDGRVSGPVPGTVAGSAEATSFAGPTLTQAGGFAATQQIEPAPQSFTAETWIKTTTKTGGKILGFSNSTTRTQSKVDRHLYMDISGRLHAGVYPDRAEVASSAKAYNDGKWHHVAMSLGDDGLILYVDGEKVAQNTEATRAEYYDGYWHLGGGSLRNWPNAPSATDFTGHVDDTVVYGKALPADRIRAHYTAAGGAQSEPVPPTASFTATATDLTAAFDASGSKPGDAALESWTWKFGDGSTGTGNKTTHDYAKAGTYTVELTVKDADGRTATTSRSVTVTAPEPDPGDPAEPRVLVDDAFDRTGDGFGSPGAGMTWSPWSSRATLSTADGAGRMAWSAPGAMASARLIGLSARDSDVRTKVRFADAPDGGGGWFSVQSRRSGSDYYAATLRARTGGTASLALVRSVGGQEVTLGTASLADLPVGKDQELNIRFETVSAAGGSGSTLRAKVWPTGTPEPEQWQVVTEEATAGLQREGLFELGYYVSGSATNAPGNLHVNHFTAAEPGASPAPEPQPEPEPEPEPEPGPAEPAMLLDDAFDRTGAGFGSPAEGLTWSQWGNKATLSTADGSGRMSWSGAGAAASSRLYGLSRLDSDVRTKVRFAPAPNGGGGWFSVQSRRSGGDYYAATLRARTGGDAQLSLVRALGSKEEVLDVVTLPDLPVAADRELNVRLETVTAGAGSTLRAKVWPTGTEEPQQWQVVAEDATAGLQRAGLFELGYYVSGSATNAPGTLHVNHFTARAAASGAAG